jgi:hypothetical protein
MGLEAESDVILGSAKARCRLHLDSDALVMRGGHRLKIPFSEVKSIEVRAGVLDLRFSGRRARLCLGPAAEAWAQKIRSPRGLMDKLGVKPTSTVVLLGISDPSLLAEFKGRAKSVKRRASPGAELVFCQIAAKAHLDRLKGLRGLLAPQGALWMFWPKGKEALREDDIRAALPPVGLVDVKVVNVSPVLSGLKLVIPLALRGGIGS